MRSDLDDQGRVPAPIGLLSHNPELEDGLEVVLDALKETIFTEGWVYKVSAPLACAVGHSGCAGCKLCSLVGSVVDRLKLGCIGIAAVEVMARAWGISSIKYLISK